MKIVWIACLFLSLVGCRERETSSVKQELSGVQQEKLDAALAALFDDSEDDKLSYEYRIYQEASDTEYESMMKLLSPSLSDNMKVLASKQNRSAQEKKKEIDHKGLLLHMSNIDLAVRLNVPLLFQTEKNTEPKLIGQRNELLKIEETLFKAYPKKVATWKINMAKAMKDTAAIKAIKNQSSEEALRKTTFNKNRLAQLNSQFIALWAYHQSLSSDATVVTGPPKKPVELNGKEVKFLFGVKEDFAAHFNLRFPKILQEAEKKVTATNISDKALKDKLDKHFAFFKKISGDDFSKFQGFKNLGLEDPAELFIANFFCITRATTLLGNALEEAGISDFKEDIKGHKLVLVHIWDDKSENLYKIEKENSEEKVEKFKAWVIEAVDYYMTH